MASPAVVGTPTETAVSTASTSHVVNLPSGATGNLLVAVMSKGTPASTATINALAGWNELLDENVSLGLFIAYRVCDGTEGATTTFTSSVAVRSAWIVYEISGHISPGTQAPQVGTTATGSSTAPNPPSVSVTGGSKDILTIACFGRSGEQTDDDTWVSAAPSGFGGLLQKACGTAGTNLAGLVATAHLASTTATSDPGAFTAVTGAWRAQTIVIHPSVATDHSVPVNDTLSLADARGLTQGKSVVDTTALADTRAFTQGKGLTDTLSPSDLLARVVTAARTIPDTVALTDATTFAFTKALVDAVALSDNVDAAKGKSVQVDDSVSLADQLARVMDYGRTQQDGINLQDATLDAQGIRLGDSVVLADLLSRATTLARALNDSATLADALAISQGQLIADAITLADLVDPDITTGGTSHSRNIDDLLALTDALTFAQGQAIADTISVSDVFARQVDRGLAISDQVAILDSFLRLATYVRSPADALALSDAILTSVPRALLLADLVTLDDDQVLVNGILTQLLDAIHTGRLALGESGQKGAIAQGEISDTVGGVVDEEVQV